VLESGRSWLAKVCGMTSNSTFMGGLGLSPGVYGEATKLGVEEAPSYCRGNRFRPADSRRDEEETGCVAGDSPCWLGGVGAAAKS